MLPEIRIHPSYFDRIQKFRTPAEAIQYSKEWHASIGGVLLDEIRGAYVTSIDWCESEIMLQFNSSSYLYITAEEDSISCRLDSSPSTYEKSILQAEVILAFDCFSMKWNCSELAQKLIGSRMKGITSSGLIMLLYFQDTNLSIYNYPQENGSPLLYWNEYEE